MNKIGQLKKLLDEASKGAIPTDEFFAPLVLNSKDSLSDVISQLANALSKFKMYVGNADLELGRHSGIGKGVVNLYISKKKLPKSQLTDYYGKKEMK